MITRTVLTVRTVIQTMTMTVTMRKLKLAILAPAIAPLWAADTVLERNTSMVVVLTTGIALARVTVPVMLNPAVAAIVPQRL